jgi:hypothetical protein
MASGVQNGGQKSKGHNFGICQYISVLTSTISSVYDQQHELWTYFVKSAKNGGSIQDGASKSNFWA